MIRLVLFLFLVTYVGFIFIKVLDGREKILNLLEVLGLSFGVGLGINSLLVFLTLNLGASFRYRIIILVLALVSLLLTYSYFKNRNISAEMRSLFFQAKALIARKFDVIDLFLATIILALFSSLFYFTLTGPFNYADEFSFWGIATKLIFFDNLLFLKGFVLQGFENYPLFVPISAASINVAFGQYSENLPKIINPLMIVFLVVFLAGFLKRLKLNKKEILLFVIVLLASGRILPIYTSMLYADIAFAFFYSAAVLVYLLNITYQPHKNNYLISGILFGLCSWAKIDGFQISIMTLFVLGLFDYLYNKKNVIKKALVSLTAMVVLPALWYAYKTLHHAGEAGWSQHLFENTKYVVVNHQKLFLSMARFSLSPGYYSYFWWAVIVVILITILFYRRNKAMVVLASVSVLNVLYLLATYLFVFSAPEAIRAASFERYILHFMPVSFVLFPLFYIEIKSLEERLLKL